tara:strand:+ start:168 stop:509 length:342 start_codon:yes stop_codon:yes gene_type:complete
MEFIFHVPLMSKKRPRFTGKTAYMPKEYKEWKKNLAVQMKEWWTSEPLEKVERIHITFHGPARHDGDNLIGAVMDTANKIIWVDDRVKIIPNGCWSWKLGKQANSFIHLKVIW